MPASASSKPKAKAAAAAESTAAAAAPRRRQRPAYEHAAFEHLPVLSVAEFANPQLLSVRVPLSVLARQITAPALLSLLRRKLLFHPLDLSSVVGGAAAVAASAGASTAPTAAAAAAAPASNKSKVAVGSDSDDAGEDDDIAALRASVAKIQHEAGKPSSLDLERRSRSSLPARIVCGLHEQIKDIQVGTSTGGGGVGEQYTNVLVTVDVDTVEVLSDGLCSAKILVARGDEAEAEASAADKKKKDKKKDKDASADDAAAPARMDRDENFGFLLSIRCRNTAHYAGMSNPEQARQNRKEKKLAKQKNKSNKKSAGSDGDDDAEGQQKDGEEGAAAVEQQEEEEDFFFKAVVPVDVPKLAAAAAGSDAARQSLSGKFVLLSVEDSGRTWRAHMGLTPGISAKDFKNWFVVQSDSYSTPASDATEGGQPAAKKRNSWKGQGVDLQNPRPTRSTTKSRVVVAFKKSN